MAEPMTVTIVGGSILLSTLSAAANTSDLVQGLDSYQSLADPAAGCSLDAEPFKVTRPSDEDASSNTDKNQGLRPEGAKSDSRADKTKPAKASKDAIPERKGGAFLVGVTSKRSIVDQLTYEPDPNVSLVLDIRVLGNTAVCVPYLHSMVGFDTRLGHQVAFSCRAIEHGDGAATLVTRCLFNPFLKESGHITVWHFISFTATEPKVKFLDVTFAPRKAFKAAPSARESSIGMNLNDSVLVRPQSD